MERKNFTLLVYLLVPIELLVAQWCPRKWRFLFTVGQLGLYTAIACSALPYAANPADDYAFGTSFYSVLASLNFFVLSDPYRDHWWTTRSLPRKEASSSQEHQAEKAIAFDQLQTNERIIWCFSNGLETRGVGWNWQIPHLPPGPPMDISLPEYLKRLALSLLKLYLTHDFSAGLLNSLTLGGQVSFKELGTLRRNAAVVSFAFSNLTLLGILYEFMCLIGAISGLFWTQYHENVPLFGSISDCFTVGRFWGRVWHQNTRRTFQVLGRYTVKNILQVKRGTFASRYIQVYVAFFLSGLYHYIAARVALPSQQFHGTWQFFAMQPFLLLLEDIVMSVAKQNLGMTSSAWRLLGYVWTFQVLILTGSGFVEDSIKFQLVPASSAFPFSIAGKFLPARI